jgi:hypothetical protein
MKMGVGGISAKVDRFTEQILSDLPDDDVTGRLKRLQYVIDCLTLDNSKDAARLALQMWRTSPLFCRTQ